MNRNKQIHPWILLILIAGAITVSAATASAQNMHVLMMIDDGHPKTGRAHEIDKDRIEGLMEITISDMFEKERPDATVNIKELLSSDNTLTMENIFDWFRNLNPSPDDVVFVYYSGPGGADEENPKRRYLKIGELKLYREGIATIIEVMQCRLKILITDTYNNTIVISIHPSMARASDDIFGDLFLKHEGFLNLTSAASGQIAIADEIEGGLFTQTLMGEIAVPFLSELDRKPQDGFVSWEEVFELTKEIMNYSYEASEPAFPSSLKDTLQQRNQTTQTPEVLSDFPKRIR